MLEMDPVSSLRVAVWSCDPDVAVVASTAFDDWEVHEVDGLDNLAFLEGQGRLDYILIDVDALLEFSASGDHRGCLKTLRRASIGARVVVITVPERVRDAVDFVRMGVDDFLTVPLTVEGLVHVRESIVRQERTRAEISYLRSHVWDSEPLSAIPNRSAAMTAALFKIRQVAPTRSTVLLTGETGTGKSFLAGALHRASSRSGRQLVRVHCGAIPDTLLESELFGHERGAFTGADRRKLGKFEIADGGSLLLDEVSTVSPAMQVKLLHVLQERKLQRVGGEHDIEVDVRVVAATNVDLARLTEEGSFRKDLYYRLNVFPIEIPPLRERREDIPLLVEALFERLCGALGKQTIDLHPAVMEAFLGYDWPGNVRELENLLERAVILETGSRLLPEDFPEEIFAAHTVGRIPVDPEENLAEVRSRAVYRAEALYLREQLTVHRGRIEETARAAGISPRQLHRLMLRHGLKKEDFKA
jgi:DNA-binding NtrC family response regulator